MEGDTKERCADHSLIQGSQEKQQWEIGTLQRRDLNCCALNLDMLIELVRLVNRRFENKFNRFYL